MANHRSGLGVKMPAEGNADGDMVGSKGTIGARSRGKK